MIGDSIRDGPSVPTGYDLQIFGKLDSTNAQALRFAESGAFNSTWIWAKQQTAGRGRRGRPWISSRYNLACSLYMALDRPLAECAQLSFVAGLSVRDTLIAFEPAAAVTLKWPNDVLVDRKKCAGILLESRTLGETQLVGLAIGIGINLNVHPDNVDYPATNLAQYTTFPPEPDYAMQQLMRAFASWHDIWVSQGFAVIRAAWLNHCQGQNQEIVVKRNGDTLSGIFNSLTPTGELEVLLPSGQIRTVAAGDLYFVDDGDEE